MSSKHFVVTVNVSYHNNQGTFMRQPVVGVYDTYEKATKVVQYLIKKDPFYDYLSEENFSIEDVIINDITYDDIIIDNSFLTHQISQPPNNPTTK